MIQFKVYIYIYIHTQLYIRLFLCKIIWRKNVRHLLLNFKFYYIFVIIYNNILLLIIPVYNILYIILYI